MVGDRERERSRPPAGRLRLRTLGELRLTGPTGELLAGRRKELVLLTYLARRSPRPVRRAELIGLLWGERAEARARQSLRQALLQLRRALGEGLEVDPEVVRLEGDVVDLDLRALEMDRAAGRPELAVERWGGEFLIGADEVGGEAFRAWLEGEREAARRQLAGAFQQIVEARAAEGDGVGAGRWAERWVEIFPLDELATRHWIEALSRSGRSREALAIHAAFLSRFRRELDAEPSSSFRRLGAALAEPEMRAVPATLASAGFATFFTPELVGRDAARGELTTAWEDVAGGGATVVLEGAEGMGKTVLSEQFLQHLAHSENAPFVLRARGREEERGRSWALVRELFAGLPDAPGLGGVPDPVLTAVSWLVPSIRDRFLGLPAPPRSQRGLPAMVGEVLATIAEEVPVVVFVDDLLHADLESRDVVLRLAHDPRPGVLVLVTARPGWADPSGTLAELCRFPGVRRIKLAPLNVAEIEALLGSMIELPAPDRVTLARRLHADTGGNPFYSSEIVGAMVDEGRLAPDAHGIWRPAPAAGVQPLPVPATVREGLGRRLGRLGDGARWVVGIAATLPVPSPRSRLQQEAALPPDRFDAALDELIAGRLLRAARSAHEAFELTPPLMQRVARHPWARSRISRSVPSAAGP
jgi:DNA-binding SARP family transcriptional activator